MKANAVKPDPAAERDWWWIFDPRLSLRAAAALAAGGGTLLLLVLITWTASVTLRRTIEAQAGSAFETLAVQVTDKIDRTIYERSRTLQLAATLAPLRTPGVSSGERRRVLEAVQESSPDFLWIGLADATGHVVAATRGQSEGSAAGERSWFLLARERPYAGNPREVSGAGGDEPEGPTRAFDLAVPVTGPNGEFAGVLGAQVRWAWTRDVQHSVVSEAARRELIGVTLYGPNKEVLLDSGASGWTQPPEAPATDGRRSRGAMLEDTAGGTRYLTGFARSRGFREYRGQGWLAAVRQPVERAFAPVEAMKRAIASWGCLLVVAASTLSWIAAGRLARRLHSVGLAAQRIRDGDILSVLPRPAGDSEIAGMCSALAEMVDDFRAKQERLSTENAQRTKAEGKEAAKR